MLKSPPPLQMNGGMVRGSEVIADRACKENGFVELSEDASKNPWAVLCECRRSTARLTQPLPPSSLQLLVCREALLQTLRKKCGKKQSTNPFFNCHSSHSVSCTSHCLLIINKQILLLFCTFIWPSLGMMKGKVVVCPAPVLVVLLDCMHTQHNIALFMDQVLQYMCVG